MRTVSRPRALPAVGRLVNEAAYVRLQERYPRNLVVAALREQVDAERNDGALSADERVASVEARLAAWAQPRLRRVINASGVVLHTNLGRAPLSEAAVEALTQAARSYSNLELDLESGVRGERAALIDPLLRRLTGAERAFAVNNNAGAVLLALTALCRNREVVVSRGQQVEIGGSFRMPDVMRLSGARMVEVGTTNRTRRRDYEEAITPRTAALLRVHPSNFRVHGFTESVSLSELSEVARAHDLVLIDDLGSGALQVIADEPVVVDSVRHADVVTFSGDKLLGGPQAGIVVGREGAVRRIEKHPLARALRADKLTLAALEATLLQWARGAEADIPVQRMLALTKEQLRRRAALWLVKLQERGIDCRLVEGASAAGGGSLPDVDLPTVLVAIAGRASRLAGELRRADRPVIVRVEADECRLDPRTVLRGEDEDMLDAVERAVAATRAGRR